jgi:superfamily II DNA or RNA helicase
MSLQPPLDPANRLTEASAVAAGAASLLDRLRSSQAALRESYDAERRRLVDEQLQRMPLNVLQDATSGRLRTGALERGGIRSVAAVHKSDARSLMRLDGVGEATAQQAIAAANQIERSLFESVRVRFDPERRPTTQADLLSALRDGQILQHEVGAMAESLATVSERLLRDIPLAQFHQRRVRRVLASPRKRREAAEAAERIDRFFTDPATAPWRDLIRTTEHRVHTALAAADVWPDFEARSVQYNGWLIEFGGLEPDVSAAEGQLPAELVEQVKAIALDTSLLNVSLRGYQRFGAQYALAQQRVIIGDEMGLGKTIEALAVLCHLRSLGETHFLVVAPASVLTNWEHEIRRHTRLDRTWRLHGAGRDAELNKWVRTGGVAVTTFDTLKALRLPTGGPGAIIVDEAHYIKNPSAQRTKVTMQWIKRSRHALLMTGTPMENRVEEFQTLVSHIRPDVARQVVSFAGPEAFRATVAPVYLRRNQDDVLNELPARIESEDWLRLDGAALGSYRDAVGNGDFMAMRRAATMTSDPADSPKIARLLEVVDDAVDRGRKVVVFSYFRDVLERVAGILGDLTFGPLTGSVRPADRQLLVDKFSASREPAVLVSQIEAGGTGMNMQAASVVVLMEPQWKPSIENQAIARCHRMGQVLPVEVHRLLTEDSVDQRMMEILSRKSALFDAYARESAVKDASPAAVDITDNSAVEEVVSHLEQERRIIEIERRRLGLVGEQTQDAPL